VKWLRTLQGPGNYPVVSLADKFMNTKFGGRQRPHFIIRNWISFGPDGMTPLPAPAPQGKLPGGAHVVKEPTLREEMDGDKIPF
jgi:hypothetical protein